MTPLIGTPAAPQQMPITPLSSSGFTPTTAMPQFTDEHFGPTDSNGIKPFNDKAHGVISQWASNAGNQNDLSGNTGFMGLPSGNGLVSTVGKFMANGGFGEYRSMTINPNLSLLLIPSTISRAHPGRMMVAE